MIRPYIIWLSAIAVFSLAIRIDWVIKPFDLLAVVLGLVILLDGQARILVQKLWPEARPFLKYFFFLILFVVLAQAISWIRYDFNPLSGPRLFQYVRAAFNIYTFLLAAFLFCASKRLASLASWAVFVSPALVLPAYWIGWQKLYLAGGRLAGLMDSAIVFGSWMMVAFFIGLGLYLDAKRPWVKFGIAAWLVVIANFVWWSGSRGVWVAIPAGLVTLLLFYAFKQRVFKNIWRIIGLTVISFGLGYALLITSQSRIGRADQPYIDYIATRAVNLAVNPFYAQERTSTWQDAIAKLSRSPYGFGFYERSPAYFPSVADIYTETLVSGGFGALFMFLLMLFKIGSAVKSASEKSGERISALTVSWFAIGAATLVNIFFFNFFFTRTIWFVLGAILGIALSEKERRLT